MKNFEAVFLAAAVMSTFAAFATAEVPVTGKTSSAISVQAAPSTMQVVVIKAKRLSAAEKAALN